LTKLFGSTRAVDRVSMSIQPGDMVAFLGPSGCGKTTTLRMIAGLVQPNAGEIFLDGRSITGVPVHRRNIGMLFQNYALFPHLSVVENVAFTEAFERGDAKAVAAFWAESGPLEQAARANTRTAKRTRGMTQVDVLMEAKRRRGRDRRPARCDEMQDWGTEL